MLNILGTIGAICLIVASLPQLYLCYKNKHADGISGSMLFLWAAGLLCMLMYVLLNHSKDILLIGNYLINFILVAVILRYKLFPWRTN